MVGLIRASPIHPIFSLVTGFCISTTPIGLYNLFIGFRSYALFIFTERYKKTKGNSKKCLCCASRDFRVRLSNIIL